MNHFLTYLRWTKTEIWWYLDVVTVTQNGALCSVDATLLCRRN